MKAIAYLIVMILTGPIASIYGWAVVRFEQETRKEREMEKLKIFYSNLQRDERQLLWTTVAALAISALVLWAIISSLR